MSKRFSLKVTIDKSRDLWTVLRATEASQQGGSLNERKFQTLLQFVLLQRPFVSTTGNIRAALFG